MATYTFPCDCGNGTCSYDLESQQSALVAMGGELSVVSSEEAQHLIDEPAPAEIRPRGQSVRLPSGISYDGLIRLLEEPWNNTEEDKSRVQEATTQLAAQGDGVIVTCTCTHVWVLPVTAMPA